MSADAPNQGMTAPRPQNMQRILGAENGHALWLEESPLMTLTHPCKCQRMAGADHLLSALPTAAELAAALAPDDKSALELSLVQPLRDLEVDFEALVGPKRKLLESRGPLWCCGTLLSCALPPVCGLICCALVITPSCEKSLFVDPINEKLPGIVAQHQAAFAAAGVELNYASDVKAHSDEVVGVKKIFRDKKYDFYYSSPAVTFSRAGSL